MLGEYGIAVDYFNNANIIDPRMIYFKGVRKTELKKSKIIPIKERPDKFETFKNVDWTLAPHRGWKYYKPNYKGLRDDLVVLRHDKYLDQRIITPKSFGNAFIMAYYYLDNIFANSEFHKTDIVLSAYRNKTLNRSKNPYHIPHDGLLYSQELLESTGISELMSDSRFAKPNPTEITVGIYCDINHPVFFVGGNPYKDEQYNSIYFAASIVHDITHHKQWQVGLQVDVDDSEKQALTNEARFLLLLDYVLRDSKKSRSYVEKNIHQVIGILKSISVNKGSHVYRKYTEKSTSQFPPIPVFK